MLIMIKANKILIFSIYEKNLIKPRKVFTFNFNIKYILIVFFEPQLIESMLLDTLAI